MGGDLDLQEELGRVWLRIIPQHQVFPVNELCQLVGIRQQQCTRLTVIRPDKGETEFIFLVGSLGKPLPNRGAKAPSRVEGSQQA